MTRGNRRVHIRQLCCLGLPSEQLMPALLKAIRQFIDADSAGFFWVDARGDMTSLYAERLLPAPVRKLTPAQSALIDKAVLREREVVRVVKERAPLVETYIQNMRPDPILLQAPESDQHFLARVDFGRVINQAIIEGQIPGGVAQGIGQAGPLG